MVWEKIYIGIICTKEKLQYMTNVRNRKLECRGKQNAEIKDIQVNRFFLFSLLLNILNLKITRFYYSTLAGKYAMNKTSGTFKIMVDSQNVNVKINILTHAPMGKMHVVVIIIIIITTILIFFLLTFLFKTCDPWLEKKWYQNITVFSKVLVLKSLT